MAKKQRQKVRSVVKVEPQVQQKQRHETVRERITELTESTETQYLELAELLSEAYHGGYAAQWGYLDFKSYAGAELKTGSRKAYYMVQAWDKTKELNLTRSKVEGLGWTKFKELVQVATADNIDGWMDKAEDLSSRELIEEVKAYKRTVKDPDAPEPTQVTHVKLKLSEDNAQPFTEAIRQARTILGTESDAEALAHICMDWLESQPDTPQLLPLERAIKWIESAYSVKVALDHTEETDEEEPSIEDAFPETEEEEVGEEEDGEEPDEEEEDIADDPEEDDEEAEDDDDIEEEEEDDPPARKGKQKEVSLDDLLNA